MVSDWLADKRGSLPKTSSIKNDKGLPQVIFPAHVLYCATGGEQVHFYKLICTSIAISGQIQVGKLPKRLTVGAVMTE